MYYSVKLNWMQPKEGGASDEMQKMNKSFIVNAESCTEAEARMIDWAPDNYQDYTVSEVKKINISEIKNYKAQDTFWTVKVLDDMGGQIKPKPYYVVYGCDSLSKAVELAEADWANCEIEEVKKLKQIVDDELVEL